MMIKSLSVLTAVAGIVFGGFALAADKEQKDPLAGLKCPVSGKPIAKDATAKYREGKVYFCCPGCPGAFEKNTAKFAAKANQQLYASKQYKLVKCPITGRDLNTKTAIEVAGTKVCFCCPGCQGKVKKAEGEAKLELVFADKPFEKGFAPKKAEKKKAEKKKAEKKKQ